MTAASKTNLPVKTRPCRKCGIIFSEKHCKECARIHHAKKYIENRDKYIAASSAWQKANPDRARKSTAKWSKANPEKAKSITLKWRERNPDAMKRHVQNRRARENGDGSELSKGLADKLFALQKGKCACCKRRLGDDYHMDHIMPLSKGGANTDDNIQLLTATCNLQKHSKDPIDFMQERGFLI